MTKSKIHIINGPNLNLLGKREPDIYGNESMDERLTSLRQEFPQMEISYFQSNIEGEIINEIQKIAADNLGLIINPGGYSHSSVAIADALRFLKIPVIEVHISNLYSREEYRNRSITGTASKGVIMGLGMQGYSLAVKALIGS